MSHQMPAFPRKRQDLLNPSFILAFKMSKFTTNSQLYPRKNRETGLFQDYPSFIQAFEFTIQISRKSQDFFSGKRPEKKLGFNHFFQLYSSSIQAKIVKIYRQDFKEYSGIIPAFILVLSWNYSLSFPSLFSCGITFEGHNKPIDTKIILRPILCGKYSNQTWTLFIV